MEDVETDTNLHHEENGIHDDERHDKVLKSSRDNNPPNLIFVGVFVFGNISLEWFCTYGKIDAGLLVLIDFSLLQFFFSLFLECDDDQGDEDIHEKEWEYDKKYYVIKR